uniref:PID domain-containing protein n=1 Tax=Timema shepardi TaxID=629360 RepID=A0A7R9AS59_TIMSH|nr:unnamed protein product [Timema shepardi]
MRCRGVCCDGSITAGSDVTTNYRLADALVVLSSTTEDGEIEVRISGESPRRMDRLRRSFRDSFKRRKEPHVPESSKPHQWQADEAAVRAGTCSFHVKYLGCVEVFESRGMQVCEEALKVLRNSRRRPVKAILYVSGDGLRVVEDETKGLIVDQTIEKVSFCAPDRNHEKGFSYICRDGTTRRWMCHGFLALKESGERLSHAVGCAFAACLERKQRRDKECGVTMTFDSKNSTFTRTGSFRQTSITERLQDPLDDKVEGDPADQPPVKQQVFNPHAIERPHATLSMLQRQGSFRGFTQLNQASPFKRQMSLRISDLPSTLERQRSLSLEGSDFRLPPTHMKTPASPAPPYRSRLQSLPATSMHLSTNMSPIPESSPLSDRGDSVSAMCQQLSQGLTLLSNADNFLADSLAAIQLANALVVLSSTVEDRKIEIRISRVPVSTSTVTASRELFYVNNAVPAPESNHSISEETKMNNNNNSTTAHLFGGVTLAGPRVSWGSPILPPRATPHLRSSHQPAPLLSGELLFHLILVTNSPVTSVYPRTELPRPDQWLGNVVSSTSVHSRRPPPLSHLRTHSLGSAETFHNANGGPYVPRDPFDAEWAAIAARNQQQAAASNTNPFIAPPSAVKAFEVQM